MHKNTHGRDDDADESSSAAANPFAASVERRLQEVPRS